ncbi:MAG: hypothetical protein V1844_01120 [Pseudomonadota bacterium]
MLATIAPPILWNRISSFNVPAAAGLGAIYRCLNLIPPPPPLWIDTSLRGVKYLLLAIFVWIVFSMSPPAIHEFLSSPYYQLSDAKCFAFILA